MNSFIYSRSPVAFESFTFILETASPLESTVFTCCAPPEPLVFSGFLSSSICCVIVIPSTSFNTLHRQSARIIPPSYQLQNSSLFSSASSFFIHLIYLLLLQFLNLLLLFRNNRITLRNLNRQS